MVEVTGVDMVFMPSILAGDSQDVRVFGFMMLDQIATKNGWKTLQD